MAQYHSFLVRVWRSAGSDGEQLAGRVYHLQTTESRRFLSLEELSTHLREVLGVSATPRDAPRAAGTAREETQEP